MSERAQSAHAPQHVFRGDKQGTVQLYRFGAERLESCAEETNNTVPQHWPYYFIFSGYPPLSHPAESSLSGAVGMLLTLHRGIYRVNAAEDRQQGCP